MAALSTGRPLRPEFPPGRQFPVPADDGDRGPRRRHLVEGVLPGPAGADHPEGLTSGSAC